MTYGQSVMAETYKAQTGMANMTAETKSAGEKTWNLALKLLGEDKIQPPPFELRQGLEGALQGMDDLRKGEVSGKKIISQLV